MDWAKVRRNRNLVNGRARYAESVLCRLRKREKGKERKGKY